MTRFYHKCKEESSINFNFKDKKCQVSVSCIYDAMGCVRGVHHDAALFNGYLLVALIVDSLTLENNIELIVILMHVHSKSALRWNDSVIDKLHGGVHLMVIQNSCVIAKFKREMAGRYFDRSIESIAFLYWAICLL